MRCNPVEKDYLTLFGQLVREFNQKSDPLNIAKAAKGLDNTWVVQRRKSEDLDLCPNSRKGLIFRAFSHYQLCTLVNRTTHSTWDEAMA